jgi:hypothetical protein
MLRRRRIVVALTKGATRRKRCINQITKKDFEHRLKTKSKNRGRAHEGREEKKEVFSSDQGNIEHRLKTEDIGRMACVQVHKTMLRRLRIVVALTKGATRRKRCINQITKKDFEHRLKTKSKNRGRAHEGRDEEKKVCKPEYQEGFRTQIKDKA